MRPRPRRGRAARSGRHRACAEQLVRVRRAERMPGGGEGMSAVFDIVHDLPLARVRLELLFDPGTFRPIRSSVGDGVVAGSGRVNGRAVCAWAQDGTHRGGSLGAAGGETIARTIARADALGCPVVGFPHSGGARLQEGTASLQAYAAIFRAQATAVVPQVSVIGGARAGGAAYSPALGDLTMMAGFEARLFLTGRQIVEAVPRERSRPRSSAARRCIRT